MRMLAAGGLLYDIGMLHLDPVLQRPQQELSAEQRRHLYTHPLVSVLLLERHHEYPPELLRAVRERHECLDGSGYPRGIAGESISGWGRILGLTKLVAALSAPGVPAAAQRLSAVLRMNRHRYHTPLAREIERALQTVPATALAGDAPDPLQTLPEIERALAAWPTDPPASLDSGRRTAVAVIRDQCAQVLRLLDDAGVGCEALAAFGAQGLSDAERVELTLVAREAGWQLRVVARQARRRIRDSEGPLPPWVESWLADADALCARLLADAAPA